MLVSEELVTAINDQHPVKTTTATEGTAFKESADLKNNQSSNSNGVPYSTLSLGRKGKRGMSQLGEDENVVQAAPAEDKESLECKKETLTAFMVETPEYTLILPDINSYPSDFRDFLKKDLLETSTLVSLEHAGRLNWWVDLGICRRLFPLVTTGDGNCLLHAACLALTGLHDNRLILRKALGKMMCQSPFKSAFFRRWRWHQTIINKQSELVFTEAEWMEEWNNLAKLASTQPRIPTQIPIDSSAACNRQRSCEECDDMEEILYESLEELHVFILAHVLKRTIIIIADTILKNLNGEALAPISFGGIYLPLECPPKECLKSPLLLTYDAAHFSALVPMEDNTDATNLADAIPLVDPDFELLPVHFAYDPGQSFAWSSLEDNSDIVVEEHQNELQLLKLLQLYMDVKFLTVSFGGELDGKSDKNESDKELFPNGSKDKANSNNHSSAVNFSGSTSSRTGSSQSSPEENSAESAKSAEDRKKHSNSSPSDKKKLNGKNKKFSSFKKRLGRTFKMGFCTSGNQQDLEEIEEQCEKKAGSCSNGGRRTSKKVKAAEEIKSVKKTSPENMKKTVTNENDGGVEKPGTKSPGSIEIASEIKSNDECEKSQFTDVTSKLEAHSPTQLKYPDRVLCAQLFHKRDEGQDRILKRYFSVAQERFNQYKKEDKKENQNCLATNCHLNPRQTSAGMFNGHSSGYSNCASRLPTMQCINSGCLGFDACAETSYLCRDCFERQKQEELDMTIKLTSHKQMHQQQFVQPHLHYLTTQSKYVSSVTSPTNSSSTVHLPLIKTTNSGSHGNSYLPGYKNMNFQHQPPGSQHPFVNHYSKPQSSSGYPPNKSQIISSSSGAAAFNKSFERNFGAERTTQPSSGTSFSNQPSNFNQLTSNKFNGTSVQVNRMSYSPMRNNPNNSSQSEFTTCDKTSHGHHMNSPLPSMYASEEDDDEDEEDGVYNDRDSERELNDSFATKTNRTPDFQQTRIIPHSLPASGTVFYKSSQKFSNSSASKHPDQNSSIKTWSNGFRSTSFDDKPCLPQSGTADAVVSPWFCKTSICKTEGCSFYGTANFDYFCSRCYKQKSVSAGENDTGTTASMPTAVLAKKSIVL